MRPVINVVGAGLAGSIVAALLRREDFYVRVIDDKDERSASAASSNLFITSWLKKFSSDQAANGIATLEKLYGPNYIDKPFAGGMSAAMSVRHIAQRHVLIERDITGKVVEVNNLGVRMENGDVHVGPSVVCTGYRASSELLNLPVWVKVGHCFLFEGRLSPGQSRLALVSPYVHEKLYQFDDTSVYYADSVAVKLDVYKKRGEELKARTLARARKHIGDLPVKDFKVGYRPFVDGHDFGFAAEVRPNVWAVNGGGKNGMVAYANAATNVLAQLRARFDA